MFISAVEDEALIGEAATGITPRRYWHREGGAIYLSCGEGRMAKITAGGAAMVDNGTDGVVFEQGYALDPWELLPEGEARDPFAACRVFADISTVDGRGLMLVRLWFSGMFGSVGWKPLLVLTGDVGSGKTRVAVAMFQLLGIPQRVTAIDALGNIKDFWTSVDKGGLFCLDNADHYVPWLPDACRLFHGRTFEKRLIRIPRRSPRSQVLTVVTSAALFASARGSATGRSTVNGSVERTRPKR